MAILKRGVETIIHRRRFGQVKRFTGAATLIEWNELLLLLVGHPELVAN